MFSGLKLLCDNSSDEEQLPPPKPKEPSPKFIRAPKQPKPKSIPKLPFEGTCKGHICDYDEHDLNPLLFPTPNELLRAYIPRLPTIAPLGTGFTPLEITPYTPTANTTIQVKFQQSLFAVNQDWEYDMDLPIETTLIYKNLATTTVILPYYKRTFIRLPQHHSDYIIKCYHEYYQPPNLDYLLQLYFYVLQNVHNTKLIAMNKGVLDSRLIELTKHREEQSIIEFQLIWDKLQSQYENGNDSEDNSDNNDDQNNTHQVIDEQDKQNEMNTTIQNVENNNENHLDDWSVVTSDDYDEDYEHNQNMHDHHQQQQAQTTTATNITIADEDYFQHISPTQQQEQQLKEESLPHQSLPTQLQTNTKYTQQYDIEYGTNYHHKYPTLYNNNDPITDNGKLIQIYIGHKYPHLPLDLSLISSFPLSMIRQHEYSYYGVIEYPFREYALIPIPLTYLMPKTYTLYQQSLLFIYNIFKREIYHLLQEFRDRDMVVERIQDEITSDTITRVKCKECLAICLHNQCYIEYHPSTPFRTLVEDFIIQYTNQNNIQNNNNSSQLHENRQQQSSQQQQHQFVRLKVPQIIYSSETNDVVQGYYLANDELTLQWIQYHTINAKLIPICGKCRNTRITKLKNNNSNGYFTYLPVEELF